MTNSNYFKRFTKAIEEISILKEELAETESLVDYVHECKEAAITMCLKITEEASKSTDTNCGHHIGRMIREAYEIEAV